MKLLIGIPSCREYKPFWESMDSFLPLVGAIHQTTVLEVRNRKIADARNIIVSEFLEGDFEYLLFLDDDHSGHTVEMLDALINGNSLVCAMKCYSRFFPHLCTLMNYSGLHDDRGKYKSVELNKGYQECDLVGFGMTLLNRKLFSLIEIPYFVSNSNFQQEDNNFCDSLINKGIRPVGCFDYVCTHNGTDDSNLEQRRNKGLIELVEDIRINIPNYNNEHLVVMG